MAGERSPHVWLPYVSEGHHMGGDSTLRRRSGSREGQAPQGVVVERGKATDSGVGRGGGRSALRGGAAASSQPGPGLSAM